LKDTVQLTEMFIYHKLTELWKVGIYIA